MSLGFHKSTNKRSPDLPTLSNPVQRKKDDSFRKAMVRAIQEIKAQHYCGSQEAYAYLKEKGQYYDMAYTINRTLRREFSGAGLPNAAEIEDLERQLDIFLWRFFSLKIYGDIEGWQKETKDQPLVEKASRTWRQDNVINFALEYYRRLLACENPVPYTRQTVFIQLCEQWLGALDPTLKDYLEDTAEDLGKDMAYFEAERVNQYFNVGQIYQRMVNDHLLNRDDYQRALIASWLDGLRHFYWAQAFCAGGLTAGDFPKTYDELVESERWRMEESQSEYQAKKNEATRFNFEMNDYLHRILRRHKSFVVKRLKEFNET